MFLNPKYSEFKIDLFSANSFPYGIEIDGNCPWTLGKIQKLYCKHLKWYGDVN